MVNRFSLLCISSLIAISGLAQSDETSRYNNVKSFADYDKLYGSLGPEFSVIYQKQFFGEIGLNYSLFDAPEKVIPPSVPYCFKLATEYNFNKNQPILVPKFSAEANILILHFKASVADYTNLKINDWRIIPETGLTFLGVCTLAYGWNIPVTHSRLNGVSPQRISLSFNMNIDFFFRYPAYLHQNNL